MSVYLESCENVEAPFALKSKSQIQRMTRRTFSEYHTFTLNTKRTSLNLSLPLSGTPDFQTTASYFFYFQR